jgi:hypothetical protein
MNKCSSEVNGDSLSRQSQSLVTMPLLGAHMSVAGDSRAVERAVHCVRSDLREERQPVARTRFPRDREFRVQIGGRDRSGGSHVT